jgi:ATP-dependent helicase/nuclease subunit B
MGHRVGERIDSWIRGGGVVVTASERTARALGTAFDHRRRAEGLRAWPAPAIRSWTGFAIAAWQTHAGDERMLLNHAQEQALWAEIIAREQHLATALETPRYRMAAMALEAHERICNYAPAYLDRPKRAAWDLDAGAFSAWLSAFDAACRDSALLSPSRAPLETLDRLRTDPVARPPLLAVGFDRILPLQRSLFEAWGSWQELNGEEPAREIHFYSTSDEETELAACAKWCVNRLAERPEARLLVLCQQIGSRRGEIERAFLRHIGLNRIPLFEFSLGIRLNEVPHVRAAHLVLRWLDGPLAEQELDWLFSAGLVAADSGEPVALQTFMRALRRQGLAQPEWTIQALANQRVASAQLPAAWLGRLQRARQLLSTCVRRQQSALDWAALVPELLSVAGLPGERSLSSEEFQAWRRWGQVIDICGSLGFDGGPIGWGGFLSALARVLADTLFSPESSNAPIQIAGPAESAGLIADAIWFLGADEDSWPASGSAHPLIPLQVQRETGMPHASPQEDWQLAAAMSKRLLHSAPVVHFSFAARRQESDLRASRLIAEMAVRPAPLPASLSAHTGAEPIAVAFADASQVPFPAGKIQGGSSILTLQSQCPFKAFATARLGATTWEPAEFGLTKAQRGLLLHAALHAIWAGPPDGFQSHQDLLACPDLDAFIAGHLRRTFAEKLSTEIRDRMPQRYLELESVRLTRVIAEWLAYEQTRLPFTVVETESTRTIDVAGLSLDLRLDRIDRLQDESLLVIDYKTGYVSPNSWQLPRPDDVQLPLYACYGLNARAGGLTFARVKVGNNEFAGRVRDARNTLFGALSGNSSLVKQILTDEQIAEWKTSIEQLARDFIAGRAEVDPREFPATCDACQFHAICRVYENWIEPEPEDEFEELRYD